MNAELEEDEPLSRPPVGAMVSGILAIAGIVAVFVLRPALPHSEVRIRNNTAYPLQQVVINDQLYGDINAGESSEYRRLRVAYRYASVRLIAGAREMRLTPEDYVGEVALGNGKFTYVLNIVHADRIDLTVEKD